MVARRQKSIFSFQHDDTVKSSNDSDDDISQEERAIQKMGKKYMRLMNDDRWLVELDRLGQNLDSIKNIRKQNN